MNTYQTKKYAALVRRYTRAGVVLTPVHVGATRFKRGRGTSVAVCLEHIHRDLPNGECLMPFGAGAGRYRVEIGVEATDQ